MLLVVSFLYYNVFIKVEFNLLVVCICGILRYGLIRVKINFNVFLCNIYLWIGDSEWL